MLFESCCEKNAGEFCVKQIKSDKRDTDTDTRNCVRQEVQSFRTLRGSLSPKNAVNQLLENR